MPLATALLLVTAAVLAVAPPTAEALTCGNVVSFLTPCIGYARGKTKEIPGGCCSGVRNLNTAAKTTADRQTACNCLKNTVATIGGIDLNIVSGIPSKCNVRIPYPISTSVDCSTSV